MLRRLLCVFAWLAGLGVAQAGVDRRLDADLGGTALKVYAYTPAHCALRGAVLAFHGRARNARDYRDDAEVLADRSCVAIFAPEFDAARFSNAAYQRGGVTADAASLSEAPIRLVPPLIAWARAQIGADLPVVLLGHSGGAQFLSRAAAYEPLAVSAIVVANPSTYVMPSDSIAAPYGMKFMQNQKLTPILSDYLKAPVILLQGGDDQTDDHHMADGPQARAQGANRLERGANAFAMAQESARVLGVPCLWRRVIVPGVGHDARAMFASAQMQAIAAEIFGSHQNPE